MKRRISLSRYKGWGIQNITNTYSNGTKHTIEPTTEPGKPPSPPPKEKN